MFPFDRDLKLDSIVADFREQYTRLLVTCDYNRRHDKTTTSSWWYLPVTYCQLLSATRWMRLIVSPW